jgi:hypothetical protein
MIVEIYTNARVALGSRYRNPRAIPLLHDSSLRLGHIYEGVPLLDLGRAELLHALGQADTLQPPAPWLSSPQILQPWKLVHVLPKLQEEFLAQAKQNCLPLGASIVCLLLALGASLAVGLPDAVTSAFQSAGKWSDPPQRKQ